MADTDLFPHTSTSASSLHSTGARRRRATFAVLGAGAMVTSALVVGAPAGADDADPFLSMESVMGHIATFDVIAGNGSGVAEIIDTSSDGTQLVYTDGDNGEIGFVDITNPHEPEAAGTVDVGGEPTALIVRKNYVFVGVNTSESFTEPSGQLVVVGRFNRKVLKTFDLGGQPDSVALSPDEDWLAVVIENERDEDLDDGLIPQNETGGLIIFDLRTSGLNWRSFTADLSPVAANAFAGTDLEPEFVDINDRNRAVVTFQENNHLAVVNLYTGETVSEFSAGSAELTDVDTDEDDLIDLASAIVKRREPDAVAWVDANFFVTANEGDYEDENGEEGGSRGFTVFHRDGTVVVESGWTYKHLLVAAGDYNEGRSEYKGVEPESVEVGVYGDRTLLFVGSERSNVVGVYDLEDPAAPEFLQLLPTGIGPEGVKAIPQRGLLAVSTESDVADAGIPTMINIFQTERPPSLYPTIVSADDENGLPIPWVALSGLAADPVDPSVVYAVNDSLFAAGFVYSVDVSTTPATIVDRLEVTGEPGAEIVSVVIQRAWPDEGDTDEVETKIGRYDVASGTWGFVHYPLEAEGAGGWIGLSELTLLPDGTFAVIERDKGWGPTTGPIAELKAVYGVDLDASEFRAFDDPAGLVTIDKTLLADLLPAIEENSIWTAEKLEGLAVTSDGQVYAVTDNDGVDDAPGETVFLRLGDVSTALGG
ncbi:MAG: esterase-like activity of phytase family protein [Ilumatobacter sp.]